MTYPLTSFAWLKHWHPSVKVHVIHPSPCEPNKVSENNSKLRLLLGATTLWFPSLWFTSLYAYIYIYIYIYIHLLTPNPATVLLQVFFLIGTVRCVLFTSISESPGVILVFLSSILVAFGGPGSPRDPKGSPMRKRADSGSYSPPYLGIHVGTFPNKKHTKTTSGIVFLVTCGQRSFFEEDCREMDDSGS